MDNEILNKIINGPNGNKSLSPQQEKAVKCKKKYIRILAGAGAGKTETLTRRILYLLLYEKISPDEIVAFTFTEKAAQSMKSRIYNRVGEIMGEDYTKKLGKMYVGTIHAYALRILQDYFGYGNYEVLDEKQEMAFIMRRGWEIGVHQLNNHLNYGEVCRRFVDAVNVIYNELIPRDKLKSKNPDFNLLFEKYEKKLEEYHRITFGRIIYLAVKKIEEKPERLPKISHLIVDEYQDINHAQERLIELLGKDANIMVVGDPRQTIYQWRGSDDQCFERFVTGLYPNAETIVIPENRRSGTKIVNVGNSVAGRFIHKFDPMKAIKGKEGYVYVSSTKDPNDEAKWIVNQMEKLVSEKRLKYSNFGILVRSMSTSAEPFIQELKSRGIPYIVGGTAGLFRREEATAVGKLFVWLYDDGFWRDLSYRRIDHDDLVDSALNDWYLSTGLIPTTEREKIKEKLNEWKSNAKRGGYDSLQKAYHDLLNILGFRELNPNNKLNAAVMANLGRFSNLLNDYENAVRLGGNIFSMSNSNLKGLMWYIHNYASSAYEERLSEDIRGIDAVQLTTIHQAKGLEWMIVFVPALVERRFPSSHMGERKKWLIDRDLFPAERYDLKEDDERRLFYVAVTRAKSTLVLSYFNKIRNLAHISRFLEDVLQELPTQITAISTMQKKSINVDLSFLGSTEDEITTYEAGEVIDYTKCPYFYRLRHVWGYEAPLAEELGYGNALHYCLRRAVELHREKGYNPLSAILESVKNEFYLPYAPQNKVGHMKEGAKKMLMSYVSQNLDDIESVAEVEYRLEFPQKKSTITGKVDVIIERGSKVEVREYKTSTAVTKPEHASLQVKLYALGLKPLGYEVSKGSVVYLKERKIDPVDVDIKKLNNAKDQAEKIISSIQQQEFTPKLGDFCEVCDYKNICKWYKKR